MSWCQDVTGENLKKNVKEEVTQSACRSAIFGECFPQNRDAKAQVAKQSSIKLFSVSRVLIETNGHFSVTCCISGGKEASLRSIRF